MVTRPGTRTREHGRGAGPAGFTLVELLVSLVVFTIIMGGLFGLLNRTQWDYVRQRDAGRGMEALRAAEIAITTILRSAEADPLESGQGLLDPDPLGTGSFDNLRVISDLLPPEGEFSGPLEDVTFWLDADTLFVRWQADAEPEPLAHPIQRLEFKYFALDGTPITEPALVPWARSVKVTVVADRGERSGRDEWRETWVQLRNRRY